MKSTARLLNGAKFQATVRGHQVIADLPPESKDAETGISPPEFLLISLATCVGYYALDYLRANELRTEGLSVEVTSDKLRQPTRLGNFRIEVTAPDLPSEHEQLLLRVVRSCLVHNTLMNPSVIETVIHAPVSA
jgi:putative redox protein